MPPQNNIPGAAPSSSQLPSSSPMMPIPPRPAPSSSPISNGPIPRNIPPYGQTKSHRGILVTLIVIIVLLGAGAVYGYINQIGPFARPPYKAEGLASQIFAGASNIKTSSYSLSINIVSQPKDADAKPFNQAVPADSAKDASIKRDQDKYRDAKNLTTNLKEYFYSNNHYPASLASASTLNGDTISTTGFTYAAPKPTKDYTLSVNFETGEAVNAISASTKYDYASSTVISGKTVTFSSKSALYANISASSDPSSIFSVQNLQSMLAYIPANFKFDSILAGASIKKSDSSVDGKIALSGQVDMGDINAVFDTEFRKIDDNFYILVNKLPTFFVDISKLKGSWIKITPDDLSTYGSGYVSADPTTAQKDITETKQRAIDSLKLFLTIADQDHALLMNGSPAKDQVNGATAYKYDLELNKDTLPQFYSDLTTQFKAKFGDKSPITFNQATLDYLKSPQYQAVFDYMRSNTMLTLWALSDGTPVKFSYGLRLVPNSDSKNADKQIKALFTLTLSNINLPISIEVPTKTISMEDATIMLTGQSKEQYQMSKQQSAVDTLQRALSTFHALTGSYPQTLTELKQTRGDLKKQFPNVKATDSLGMSSYYVSYGLDTDPILKAIPNDVYTGSAFTYSSTGKDYKLTYTIKFPPYTAGDALPKGIFSRDYSNYSKNVMKLTVVNGTNTADSKNVSEEAVAASKIDSDGDGLPNALETYIGTNPNKKDTDGDGQSDYKEVTTGSNPLGPGSLKGGSSGMMY